MILLLLACRPAATPATNSELDPGRIRLGPPQPTVGLYDVLALDEGVYVSNLHTSFVTLADPSTGAWKGVLDLREGGLPSARFPRLESWDGRVWVSSSADALILGFLDGRFEQALELEPDDQLLGADQDGLWIGRADGLYTWDGTWTQRLELTFRPSAADRHEDAWLVLDGGRAAVEWHGDSVWRFVTGLPDLGDVELLGERAYASSRAEGAVLELGPTGVLNRAWVGSDTFDLAEHEGDLLVTNRQGAELPPSGSYQGAPGTVLRLDSELETVWELELDKTIHFLSQAPDGSWWTANEDALRLSRFDADRGEELLRGPTLGLTLDALSLYEGRLWAGSHLTDELWWLDPVSWTSGSVPTCGWPFQLVPGEDGLAYLPCQEDGQVLVLERGEVIDQVSVVDTFHQACGDGLCTGHSALVGAAWTQGGLVLGDPRERRLIWLDGGELALSGEGERGLVQHMQVVEHEGALWTWESRAGRLHGPEGPIDADPALAWPLAVSDEVWVDGRAGSGAELEGEVLAASTDWLVVIDEEALSCLDAGSLEELGRVEHAELRVPLTDELGQIAPSLGLIDGETLWLASVFGGELERRSLPDLQPLGGQELILGPWSEAAEAGDAAKGCCNDADATRQRP